MKKFVGCFIMVLTAALAVHAATWSGIQDSAGFTWARVLIINDSDADSNWSISGGRTAVQSDADNAEVDQSTDWDGRVPAGQTVYVWVYGIDLSSVTIANADGGDASYLGEFTLDAAGDGEAVIVVNADGTTSVDVVASESYAAPFVTGQLPE